MMKEKIIDLIFVLVLTLSLLVLSETDNLELVTKIPFATILVSYSLGRFVSKWSDRKKQRNLEHLAN